MNDASDIKKVINMALKEKLWEVKKGRKFYKFRTMNSNPLNRLNRDKLTTWMNNKITHYKKYKQLHEGNASDNDPYSS